MDLPAQLLVKSQTQDRSQDTLIQRTAENTTFVSKVLHVNTDVPSEQFSRSEILMDQETVKIQKMFLDGKLFLISFKFESFPKTYIIPNKFKT